MMTLLKIDNMDKQKITQLNTYDKDKQGNLLLTKDGRTYSKWLFKTNFGGDKLLSTFKDKNNANWKVGDEIEGKITETRGQNGQVYYNFETPKKDDVLASQLINHEARLGKIESWIRDHSPIRPGTKVSGTEVEYPDEPNPDDIPF